MYTVGITGGIGSGKTTIANCFAALGIPVFNADEAAKHILQTSPIVIEKIKQAFGAEIYTHQNLLNKQALAAIVFNNPTKLEQLNTIVHPATIEAAKQFIDSQKAPYVIKEAALLFEAGTAEGLNFIVGVYAPNALRIQRAMHRDGSTREQVLQRMNKQLPETLKMKLCDAVITNDDQQLVIPQILPLHQLFLQSATKH
jgi:dephospho-CoA kinase